MNAQELAKAYERSYAGLKLNLRDISDADSRVEPAGGGNSINWVLGHLVMTRGLVLRLAGAAAVSGPELVEIYSGEEGVVFDRSRARPLEQLVAELDASQERLMEALSGLSSEALAAPARNTTVADLLTFLWFHEGYHSGQLGLLRRLVGKPGVIKQPKGLVTG